MTVTGQRSVTFQTTVVASGNNTGIEVPAELITRLGAGRRPPVVVDVNGYEYRSTVGVMGGRHMIGMSAAIRKATGLAGGHPIRVTVTVADTPREVDVPADLAARPGRRRAGRGLLRDAVEQPAALPRRHGERREDRGDAAAARRRGRRAVPRGEEAVSSRAARWAPPGR